MHQHSPVSALSQWSGEFIAKSSERSYLEASWKNYQLVTRTTLLIIALMGMAFFIADLLAVNNRRLLYGLFFLRLGVVVSIIGTAVYLSRRATFFSFYPHLLLVNQLLIIAGIFVLTVMREMPIAYLGVNTVLFTLVFYQFLTSRYTFTLLAAVVLGLGAILIGLIFRDMGPAELITAILFLVPLNYLGIRILKANNRLKRNEYKALIDLAASNKEKETLIQDLQTALAEVKTLQGLLPICAHCHKIRNDEGFWDKIENYIQKRTDVRFSHGLCPDCARHLYPEIMINAKD